MNTQNIVLIVVLVIMAALIICNIIKKEEYQSIEDCISNCNSVPNLSTWAKKSNIWGCNANNGSFCIY